MELFCPSARTHHPPILTIMIIIIIVTNIILIITILSMMLIVLGIHQKSCHLWDCGYYRVSLTRSPIYQGSPTTTPHPHMPVLSLLHVYRTHVTYYRGLRDAGLTW